MLKHLVAGALALAVSLNAAFAQVNPGTSPLSIAKGGTAGATASAARTSLGLAIGSNVQAWNALLDCFSALATTGIVRRTGSGTCSAGTAVGLTSEVTGTLPLGNGGTGQTTAPAARAASGLNVDQFTGHGDSIYTILATDRTVGTNAAFTASRTWTLPAANAVNPGQEIFVADFQGTVTGSNTLIVTRAGADTINSGTSVTISAAFGAYIFKSDGISKWTAQSTGAASGGGVTSVTCFGVAITTSGTCALAASKSSQQTGTSTTDVVTPSQAQSHDSAAKAWAYCTNSAGTYTLQASYNISGGTCGKTGPGDLTLTFTTNFATANYACFATVANTFSEVANATPVTNATVRVQIYTTNTAAIVNDSFSVVCYGRQ